MLKKLYLKKWLSIFLTALLLLSTSFNYTCASDNNNTPENSTESTGKAEGGNSYYMDMDSKSLTAKFDKGSLISLADKSGNVFVEAKSDTQGVPIFLNNSTVWSDAVEGDILTKAGETAFQKFSGFKNIKNGQVEMGYISDDESGDLLIILQEQLILYFILRKTALRR